MSNNYSYITEIKAHKLTVIRMLDLAFLYLLGIENHRQIQIIMDPKSKKLSETLNGYYRHISEASCGLDAMLNHVPDVLKYDKDRIITITLSNHTFIVSDAINAVWLLSGVIRECDLWIQDIPNWSTDVSQTQVLNDTTKESLSRFKCQLKDVVHKIGLFIHESESLMLTSDGILPKADNDT